MQISTLYVNYFFSDKCFTFQKTHLRENANKVKILHYNIMIIQNRVVFKIDLWGLIVILYIWTTENLLLLKIWGVLQILGGRNHQHKYIEAMKHSNVDLIVSIYTCTASNEVF